MWIKSKEGKLINLDRVDTIEINPVNSIICKFGDGRACLGSFKTGDEARTILEDIEHELKIKVL